MLQERPPTEAKNEQVRLETYERLDARSEVPFLTFFRRLGLAHVHTEFLTPALESGQALVTAAVIDRPWPPWGIGAQRIIGLIIAHPVGDNDASLTNVFVGDEDATNLGLAAALLKEMLGQLQRRQKSEISYLVAEHATLIERLLAETGFRRSKDMVLTEHARYFLSRAPIADVLERLALDRIAMPDLLALNVEPSIYRTNALFHATLALAARPFWFETVAIPEIIANTGIGIRASQPGGVGGTKGPDRPDIIEEIERVIEIERPGEPTIIEETIIERVREFRKE